MSPIARPRQCISRDGTRIAYTIDGAGFPPVVKVAQWFSDLHDEPRSPIGGHWIAELGRRNALLRYDQRGFGASERAPVRVSLDAWVEDLEAVVDASGHPGVVLFAASQAVPVAIRFAARHPERVLALFAWGGCTRGPRRLDDTAPRTRALEASLVRARTRWDDPGTFRALFSSQFARGADAAQLDAIDRSCRTLTDGALAAATLAAWFDVDVEADARRVRCPTRVVRAEADAVVSPAEGQRLASSVPGARATTVPGSRHMPLAGDEGWTATRALLREFLDECSGRTGASTPPLSARQLEVLARVADGLTDREIGEQLGLSHRTVGVHVSGALRLLGARSRDEAVRIAVARGLLP